VNGSDPPSGDVLVTGAVHPRRPAADVKSRSRNSRQLGRIRRERLAAADEVIGILAIAGTASGLRQQLDATAAVPEPGVRSS
jgi:hypothetical protein